MTRLAIIIVSYNSRKDLETALQSLTETGPSVAHEIVVVDNASTDSTPAYIRERWPSVRLIASEANLGFAQANNLGIRNTSSELVLLVNPDTIVTGPAVDRLVSVLESRPDVAIVGPRIVDGRGRAELSFGAMISPIAELRQKILVRGNDRGVSLITGIVDRMTRRTHRVDWVSGACLLIRRQDLDQVGGFDPRFFMYAEDVDLCAAVRSHGRSVLFSAEPQVVHLRGRSAAAAPERVRNAYRRSQIAFYAKHHPGWVPFLKVYLKIIGRLPDTPH
jgi:GT2 family glycosyltransferase